MVAFTAALFKTPRRFIYVTSRQGFPDNLDRNVSPEVVEHRVPLGRKLTNHFTQNTSYTLCNVSARG